MNGRLVYLKNVVTLDFNPGKCVGCGTCIEVCPRAVLGLATGKARIEFRDACMECGACAKNCPTEAITVTAGVGCVAAVINSALGRTDNACCCVIEPHEGDHSSLPGAEAEGPSCC